MYNGPKITVIGAASFFFGKSVIHKMATSEIMQSGTLALVDLDVNRLNTMMNLAKRIFKYKKCNIKLIGSTDRKDVMYDSDFVVLTFSNRNTYFRGLEAKVAAKHGIRMCSADTIGPGGIFRSLREIPETLEIAGDVEKLCPKAWVINFVNPTATIGMALNRYARNVRSMAICDGLHLPYSDAVYCHLADIVDKDVKILPPEIEKRVDIKIAGVNHCTWIAKLTFDGKDMLQVIRQKLVKMAEFEKTDTPTKSKPRYNNSYALKLFDIYGAYPTAISHTKEYVPFFQGYGVKAVMPEPLKVFDGDLRATEMAKDWAETEKYTNGEYSEEKFLQSNYIDHATDIIESMWGKLGKEFYVNTANCGAVQNLAEDAYLELRCKLNIDDDCPRPLPFGRFPRGLISLQQQIIDAHEFTADAAVTGDKAMLKKAMILDPLCNNIEDAESCMEELLELEKEYLPQFCKANTTARIKVDSISLKAKSKVVESQIAAK